MEDGQQTPEQTPTPAPVVQAEQKPVPAVEVSSVTVESTPVASPDAAKPSTPDDVAASVDKVQASFQDTDIFDGVLPEGFEKVYPKFAGKLKATLENLREAAESNKLLEELLREDDEPKTKKELQELQAAKKSWEAQKSKYEQELAAYQKKIEDAEVERLQAQVQAEVPDIFDFAGDKGDYPALAKYIDLITKGVDTDVAAAQVRKTWNLTSGTTQAPGPKPLPKSISGMKKPSSGSTPTEPTSGAETSVDAFFENLNKKVQAEQRRRGQ